MDYSSGFSFITKEKNWVGTLFVAGLLMISVIGFPALIGWMIEIGRRASQDPDEGLPDWDEIGEYFLNGLSYLLITAVWMLPFFIFTIGGGTFFLIANDLGVITAQTEENLAVLITCLNLVGFANILGAALFSLPLMGLIGDEQSVLKLLNPVHSARVLFRNFGTYLMVMVMGWLVAFMMAGLGLVACLVGTIITAPFSYAYFGYINGQAFGFAAEQGDVRLDSPTASKKKIKDQEEEEEIPPAI